MGRSGKKIAANGYARLSDGHNDDHNNDEPEDIVVVCDNAPAHSALEEVIEEEEFAGVNILRLAPYSAPLNPTSAKKVNHFRCVAFRLIREIYFFVHYYE